jgi:methylglutaconyl-CoA hydratase
MGESTRSGEANGESMDQSQRESDSASSIVVAVDDDGHIATLTLNRPESRHAISRGLADQLPQACGDLAQRADIRAVVVTGAGDRAFCAGADLKERRSLSAPERAAHTSAIEAAVEALAALPMPSIAAIRGYALAGGAEIAIACDVRVAATDAMLGFPEVRVGIFPGAGGALRLPRLVGEGAARGLLFTGRSITADEALRVGLVDHLAAPENVFDEARVLAASIAANAPLAVRAVKRALRESRGLPLVDARRAVNALRAELDATEDYEEGLRAFAERRAPRFRGR